ncbi:hypothetical protein G9394_04730 [Proteus vulgaris]|nr:hypothetical protein G9394_04730 [Proteus vulgaris]
MKIKNIISHVYLKSGVVASMALSSSAFAADDAVTNGNYLDGLIKQIDVGYNHYRHCCCRGYYHGRCRSCNGN